MNIESELKLATRVHRNLLADEESSSTIYSTTANKYANLLETLQDSVRLVSGILAKNNASNSISTTSRLEFKRNSEEYVSRELYEFVKSERDKYISEYFNLVASNTELSVRMSEMVDKLSDNSKKKKSKNSDSREKKLDRNQRSKAKTIITSQMSSISDSVDTDDSLYSLCLFLENWYVFRFVRHSKVPNYDMKFFPAWLCKLVLNFVVAESLGDDDFFGYFNSWIEDSNESVASMEEFCLTSIPQEVFTLSYYETSVYKSKKFLANTVWKNLISGPLYGLQKDNTRSKIYLTDDDMLELFMDQGWISK